MASEKPSAWATEEARRLAVADWSAIGPTYTEALARILDAAREQGRNEREAEIVGWIEDCGWPLTANDIKRGAGRKENDRG